MISASDQKFAFLYFQSFDEAWIELNFLGTGTFSFLMGDPYWIDLMEGAGTSSASTKCTFLVCLFIFLMGASNYFYLKAGTRSPSSSLKRISSAGYLTLSPAQWDPNWSDFLIGTENSSSGTEIYVRVFEYVLPYDDVTSSLSEVTGDTNRSYPFVDTKTTSGFTLVVFCFYNAMELIR